VQQRFSRFSKATEKKKKKTGMHSSRKNKGRKDRKKKEKKKKGSGKNSSAPYLSNRKGEKGKKKTETAWRKHRGGKLGKEGGRLPVSYCSKTSRREEEFYRSQGKGGKRKKGKRKCLLVIPPTFIGRRKRGDKLEGKGGGRELETAISCLPWSAGAERLLGGKEGGGITKAPPHIEENNLEGEKKEGVLWEGKEERGKTSP